jgi:hypothetical protein
MFLDLSFFCLIEKENVTRVFAYVGVSIYYCGENQSSFCFYDLKKLKFFIFFNFKLIFFLVFSDHFKILYKK